MNATKTEIMFPARGRLPSEGVINPGTKTHALLEGGNRSEAYCWKLLQKTALSAIIILAASFYGGNSRADVITVDLRYDYDTSGFFKLNQSHMDALRAAVDALICKLQDKLAEIPLPPSSADSWTASFLDPGSDTGNTISLPNLQVPANTIIVYVGARSLPGSSERGYANHSFSYFYGGSTADLTWAASVERR